MKFEINLKSATVERDGAVRGTAIAGEAAKSRSVSARLFFREAVQGEGLDKRVAELDPVTIHEGELARGQEVWFELPLPQGALPTYSGESARLAWYVEVVADEPGSDSRGESEVVVSPEARSARRQGDLGTVGR